MQSFVKVHQSIIRVQKRSNETSVVMIYSSARCLEVQSKLTVLKFWSLWENNTDSPAIIRSPCKGLICPRATSPCSANTNWQSLRYPSGGTSFYTWFCIMRHNMQAFWVLEYLQVCQVFTIDCDLISNFLKPHAKNLFLSSI